MGSNAHRLLAIGVAAANDIRKAKVRCRHPCVSYSRRFQLEDTRVKVFKHNLLKENKYRDRHNVARGVSTWPCLGNAKLLVKCTSNIRK